MEWQLLGKKDPQLPQMFYPIEVIYWYIFLWTSSPFSSNLEATLKFQDKMFSGCWDDPYRGRHYSRQVHDGQLQGQDDLGALDVLTICVRCISNVISLCFICISVCLICISRCFIYMVHLGVSYIWWVNLGGRHCWGRDVQLLPDVLGRCQWQRSRRHG